MRSRTRLLSTIVFAVAGLAVIYLLQVAIGLVTEPNTPVPELVTRPLMQIYTWLGTISSALLAAVGGYLIPRIIPAWAEQGMRDEDDEPANATRQSRRISSEVRHERGVRQHQIEQVLAETRTQLEGVSQIARAWARESVRLREKIAAQGQLRAMFLVAVLMAAAHLICALLESALKYAGLTPPGLLGTYLQTLLLMVSAFILAFAVVRCFQATARCSSMAPALSIAWWGTAAAGFISLGTITPAMYQAISPSGWNVPVGSFQIPLFFYLCFVRLLILPALGLLGGVAGFMSSARGNEDAAFAEPIAVPKSAEQAWEVKPSRQPSPAVVQSAS